MTAAESYHELSDDLPRARFAARLANAFQRRLRHAVLPKSRPAPGHGVERALQWLVRAVSARAVVANDAATLCAAGVPCVELGEHGVARQCVRRARGLLRRDGALSDATGRAPSLYATAQFLRLANQFADGEEVELPEESLHAACRYIVAHLDRNGRLLTDERSNSLADRWGSPLSRLACLSPVATLARRWHVGHWLHLIDRAVERATASVACAPWTTPSHLWAEATAALLELGYDAEAQANVRWLDLAQRDCGAVAIRIDAGDTSPWATAHAASVWYALGNQRRGDRALTWLLSRQRANGSFGQNDNSRSPTTLASVWTTVHFLKAAQAQVRASFSGQRADLPITVDAADGRYLAVRNWLCAQDRTDRVLDAGCGSGRFLSRLRSDFAGKYWIGIDRSEQALSQLPGTCDVERRAGDLLRLPVSDAECDAAYMIEALEHSLVPRRAVDELCRAVRPGGEVLIIDKCASHQMLSQHEPWERWFTADEVGAWLAPHCEGIRVQFIPHGHHQDPTGLFLCWTARKRGSGGMRQAA